MGPVGLLLKLTDLNRNLRERERTAMRGRGTTESYTSSVGESVGGKVGEFELNKREMGDES